MKKTITLMIAFLLLAATTVANAQNTSVKYTTTHENNLYQCESDKINTIPQNNGNIYNTNFILHTFDNISSVSVIFHIITIGDKKVVSIARMHKNGDHYETIGNITMEDGERIGVGTVLVTDGTRKEKKNSTTMASVYVSLIFKNNVESVVKKLRTKNIKQIEVNGHVIEMTQNVKVNTAPIIDQMFKEVAKKGYNKNSASASPSSSPSPSPSPKQMPSQPNSSKSKSALELVYYPMGILAKDAAGLTYSSALKEVKRKTSWRINEYPTYNFFEVRNFHSNDSYDITWHGIEIYSSVLMFGKSLNWQYTINLSKSSHTLENAKTLAMSFIAELTAAGFSMDSKSYEGEKKHPIARTLTKGTYHVDLTLSVDEECDECYSISVFSYPK